MIDCRAVGPARTVWGNTVTESKQGKQSWLEHQHFTTRGEPWLQCLAFGCLLWMNRLLFGIEENHENVELGRHGKQLVIVINC